MKKWFIVFILVFAFLIFFVYSKIISNSESLLIKDVISPTKITFANGQEFILKEVNTFDSDYTENNKKLALKFNLTEDEAFILGNLGKYWAKNILHNKTVRIINGNLIYYKFNYSTRFENSPYCIKEEPVNHKAFEKLLNSIRKGKFVLVDLDTDKVYPVSKENRIKVKNFVVVRKSHVKYILQTHKTQPKVNDAFSITKNGKYKSTLDLGEIKIVVSDMTTKLYPDRNCSSDICKEILQNINSAKNTIDMAIYGYSSTPDIEKAFKNAISSGVKVRLVYDVDSKNQNIYPNTFEFVKLFSASISDKSSAESGNTMHNKFYIFDNKKVITGSANLSHTDMSGYNSNAIVVINSEKVANMYTQEFNQMFNGKFHNAKNSHPNKKEGNIEIFFSPQDKAITNAVLPIINSAQKYIYVPSFVITEKRVAEALISAYQRGVDVKIILDSLNATNNYSKHKILRQAGIPVKAENYAGKMHAKSIIVDDNYLIVGSMNFSRSGENKNDENLVVIKDSQAAKFYRDFFLYQWSNIPDKWLKYTPRAEGWDSIGSCSDGIDNNYDGKTDNKDDACKNTKLQK